MEAVVKSGTRGPVSVVRSGWEGVFTQCQDGQLPTDEHWTRAPLSEW